MMSYLMVAYKVACLLKKLPISRVQHCTENLGNFLRFVSLGERLQGCLRWQRLEGRHLFGCLIGACNVAYWRT